MPPISVIVGKDSYPTADPSTLGTSIAPLIVAGSLEVVIALTGITGEINVYALCWDVDCEKWYPLEKLVCNERVEPPLIGRNRFAGLDVPTDRYVCLYAPGVKSTEIDACYIAYTPASLMNLSSPPPIGDVAPNTLKGTTVTATTEFVGPVGTISAPAPVRGTTVTATTELKGPLGVTTQNPADVTVLGLLAGSTATPAAGKSYITPTGSVGASTGISLVQGGGRALDIKPGGASATAKTSLDPATVTIANGSFYDYDNAGKGGMLIVGDDTFGLGALINFATNSATSIIVGSTDITSVLTTPAKLNIQNSGAAKVRFENLTGASITISILPVRAVAA